MISKIYLLFALTKRDYAIQYAGSLLGILWIVIQSLFFLGLYTLIGSIFNLQQFQKDTKDFLLLLSGIVFWIPLQEYILRTSNILVENRNLLKKTTLNLYYILLVPFVQFCIHSVLLCIPLYTLLYFYKLLNNWAFILGLFSTMGFGIFLFPILVYVACSNVLLKDITPLLRILLQFLFWSLPIFYSSHSEISRILSWNPFFSFLEIFRFFIFQDYIPSLNLSSILVLLLSILLFQLFANRRILSIILDQI